MRKILFLSLTSVMFQACLGGPSIMQQKGTPNAATSKAQLLSDVDGVTTGLVDTSSANVVLSASSNSGISGSSVTFPANSITTGVVTLQEGANLAKAIAPADIALDASFGMSAASKAVTIDSADSAIVAPFRVDVARADTALMLTNSFYPAVIGLVKASNGSLTNILIPSREIQLSNGRFSFTAQNWGLYQVTWNVKEVTQSYSGLSKFKSIVTKNQENKGMTFESGTSTSPSSSSVALTLTSYSPSDGSTGVNNFSSFSFTGSTEFDLASLTGSNVFLKRILDNNKVIAPLALISSNSGKTITLASSVNLGLLQQYLVNIGTAVKSTGGKTLDRAYSWTFTTRDGDWDTPIEIATDASSSFSTSYPKAAIHENKILVTWKTSSGTSLYARVFNGSSWSNGMLIDTAHTNVHQIEPTFSSSGVPTIVYALDTATNDFAIKSSIWDGANWSSTPNMLFSSDTATVTDSSFYLEKDQNEQLHLAALRRTGSIRYLEYCKLTANGTCSNAATIREDTTAYALAVPKISVRITNGGEHIIYSYRNEVSGQHYLFAKFFDGINWTHDNGSTWVTTSSTVNGSSILQIASGAVDIFPNFDQDGNASVVFADIDNEIRESIKSSAGWSIPSTLLTITSGAPVEFKVNRRGTAVVFTRDSNVPKFIQRISSESWSDGGFTNANPFNPTTYSSLSSTMVRLNESDDIALMIFEYNATHQFHTMVYNRRIDTWTAPVIANASATSSDSAPRIEMDPGGNVMVTWIEGAPTNRQVYAARYRMQTNTWITRAAIYDATSAGGSGGSQAMGNHALLANMFGETLSIYDWHGASTPNGILYLQRFK